MEPTNRKIQALVDMFLNQELLLPEMQRKYVWRATQVRDLLDSIYRDYPSGSILIWETDNLPEVKTHAFERTAQLPIGKRLLLLDGQQRITSLTSVLTGRPVRMKEGTQIKEKTVDLYFNLDHPDADTEFQEPTETPRFEVGDVVEAKWEDGEFYTANIHKVENNRYHVVYDEGDEGWTDEVRDLSEENKKELFFQIKNKKVENKPTWISVTKLFKGGVGSILRELKIGADHPKFDTYNQRLNQLYNRKDSYLYPIQIIRDKGYREVTQIFIRVNTAGTRLRSSDLALAQITSAWAGSMKLFEGFVDQCIQKDFYLDENFLVRCLICIATGQSKFNNMGRMSLENLKASWELTKKGVQNTITFLKNNAWVDSSTLLPSPVLLIPLVSYSSKRDLCESNEVERGLLYWLYQAATWGRYSASMETVLDQDLRALRSERPWASLMENLSQVIGKERKLTVEDFRGKSINSPLFFMMYVLARKNQARDLETGNVINYANFGTDNGIENDHIFPKSKLDPFFKDKLDGSSRKRFINELANIAFMTKKGNLIKTNDDPSVYFPKVYQHYKGDDCFRRQQIPYDLTLLSYEQYQKFLERRSEMLAKAVNDFMETLAPAEVEVGRD